MTNMKHKSIDAKRQRRTRLKRAVMPIISRFNCTQMEVSGIVEGIISENAQLKRQVEESYRELKSVKDFQELELTELRKEKASLEERVAKLTVS